MQFLTDSAAFEVTMKFLHWKIRLGLGLIGASVVLYALNYLIFRDANYMLRLFLAQLGFLPISVLLVTIIINQLLCQRAKAAKLAQAQHGHRRLLQRGGRPILKISAGLRPESSARLPGRDQALRPLVRPGLCRFQPAPGGIDFGIVTGGRRSGGVA